jgi:hypothetical protein
VVQQAHPLKEAGQLHLERKLLAETQIFTLLMLQSVLLPLFHLRTHLKTLDMGWA